MAGSNVDTSKFDNSIKGIESDLIVFISHYLKRAGGVIRDNTIPFTPVRDQYLETSFTTEAKGTKARFVMSGKNNPQARGFDYARIQHDRDDFEHPLRGESEYLYKGLGGSEEDLIKLLETGVILIIKKHS